MKEHALFIEDSFTAKNQMLAVQADQLKNALTNLLSETVNFSYGIISPEVASSGEIVTQFTLNAERMTQFYTGIPVNTNVTIQEMGFRGEQHSVKPGKMVAQVDICGY